VLAALEVWFEQRDPDAELRRWNADLAAMAERLALPGVQCTVLPPQDVVCVPRLRVSWDSARYPLDGEAVRLRALDGEPRVMLDDMSTTANSVDIDPFGLEPGQADQVGRAVAAALTAPATAGSGDPAPDLDLSGQWQMHVSFLHGERTHRLLLRQQGSSIGGSQSSPMFEGPVTGSVDARGVHLLFRTRYEGATIAYQLDGAVADGRLQGRVTLGAVSDHHQGPINLSQFGSGRFEAVRA
jgi:hypothetical protein